MTGNSLCIIPARGGSKRIPRKNIRDFCGKPMIAWSIAAARESGLFEHIIISTDDDEIADIATRYGAEVPFKRPASLADDTTTTRSVINHAIWASEKIFGSSDLVCCLYATAPFVLQSDLEEGLNKLIQRQADFAVSVAQFSYPIQRALVINADGSMRIMNPDHQNTRSQDLITAYHDAGQFYWGKAQSFLEGRSSADSFTVPVILPHWRVQDIDTEDDWLRAELIFKVLMKT